MAELLDPIDYFMSKAKRKTPKRLPKAVPIESKPYLKRGGNAYRYTRTGKRVDLGNILIRSGWEADICRIAASFNISWQYEPLVFTFPIKRGIRSYTPDIKIDKDWIEVKGYMDNKSRIKLKRFSIYHPEEFQKLIIVCNKGSKQTLEICEALKVPRIMFYQDIETTFKPIIKNWE